MPQPARTALITLAAVAGLWAGGAGALEPVSGIMLVVNIPFERPVASQRDPFIGLSFGDDLQDELVPNGVTVRELRPEPENLHLSFDRPSRGGTQINGQRLGRRHDLSELLALP